jgi:hypothetical protein
MILVELGDSVGRFKRCGARWRICEEKKKSGEKKKKRFGKHKAEENTTFSLKRLNRPSQSHY